MKILWMMVVALMMTFTLSAADLAGTWKGSMETEGGAMDVTISIQPGTPLAGNIRTDHYEGKIENGKVDGEKISFESNFDPGKVTYAGTVSGDEMRLNITGTRGARYVLVCKRQK